MRRKQPINFGQPQNPKELEDQIQFLLQEYENAHPSTIVYKMEMERIKGNGSLVPLIKVRTKNFKYPPRWGEADF